MYKYSVCTHVHYTKYICKAATESEQLVSALSPFKHDHIHLLTYMYMSTVNLYLSILNTCLQCTSISPYYIHVLVYSVPLSPHTTCTCLQCTSVSPYYIHVHVYSVPLSPHTTCTCLQCTSVSPYYIHVHVYSVPLSPHTTYMYMSTVYLYLPILHVHVYSVPLSPHTTCTCSIVLVQCTCMSNTWKASLFFLNFLLSLSLSFCLLSSSSYKQTLM